MQEDGGITGEIRVWDCQGEQREEAQGQKELITQEVQGCTRAEQRILPAAALLFKADVSQVSIIDTDDAVVLLEEALLLGLASFLQSLDQQAKSPEKVQTFTSTRHEVTSAGATWRLCRERAGELSLRLLLLLHRLI